MKKKEFENCDIACFVRDTQTRDTMAEALSRLGEIHYRIFISGVDKAIEFVKLAHVQVLCVDLSDSPLLISDAEALMEFCPPDVKVIILGTKNDVAIFRDLVTINILDYLVKPVGVEIIARTFAKGLTVNGATTFERRKRTGKIILFMGTIGGIGTTTLATNSACMLANVLGKKVVLVDADMQFGNTALLMDIKASHGLHSAIDMPDRIDDLFLDQSMKIYGERLRILNSEEPLHEYLDFDNVDFIKSYDHLLDTLAAKYHYVIIDVPRHIPPLWRHLAARANTVFLVSGLSIASLRDTVRILGTITDEKITKTNGIIINTVHESKSIKLEKFEELLGRKVDVYVPYNAAALGAADLGKPLIETSSSYKKDITKIIEAINGTTVQKIQLPLIDRILNRLIKTN